MNIISKNLKQKEVKIKVENTDDLWYLSHLIEPGDIVRGQTVRKIKIGDQEQRKSEVVKKKIFVDLDVEKISFTEDALRVSGIILTGPAEVSKGSHHTLAIEEGTTVVIIKEKWLSIHLKKLEEAVALQQPAILICALDREEAIFALSQRSGYSLLSTLQGEVQKKEERMAVRGSFYEEIVDALKTYADRYKVEHIIVASPAFWKEELVNLIKDSDLKKKIVLATCSSVGKNAINEILKRPETKEVLKRDRIAKETNLVEKLLSAISKEELGTYGVKEVQQAAQAGAIEILLITDSFIRQQREKGTYDLIDSVMKIVDQTKGEIHIIASSFDGGKKLDGLGGIGALLRYRLTS